MIAHQMLTNGVVAPYYGTSAIKMFSDRDSVGMNVSPMLSCNINQSLNFHNGMAFDSIRQQESGNLITQMWYSVCCGGASNRSLDGLRRLVHSNILSPHVTDVISDGSLGYVDLCNKKSLEIFETAGFIEKKEVEPKPIDEEPEVEDKRIFQIKYSGMMPKTKIKVMKALSQTFGITLTRSRSIIESVEDNFNPNHVFRNEFTAEEASLSAKALNGQGAIVEIIEQESK